MVIQFFLGVIAVWYSKVVKVLSLLVLVCLAGEVFGQGSALAVEPACKVNKPLIKVYAGQGTGDFILVGKAGAITTTSVASVYVSNTNSGTRTEIVLAADYSFTVNIKAAAGDKIRVNAQNAQGKKSYGSFNITGAEVPFQNQNVTISNEQVVPAIKTYDLPSESQAEIPEVSVKSVAQVQTIYADEMSFNNDPAIGTNIAVVVIVINTDTGDVLSTSRISGKSKVYAEKSKENFRIMIDRIINRCTNIIESEIFRPSPQKTKPQDTVALPANSVIPADSPAGSD